MTTQLDCSIGFGPETVYGTEVTPTRFFEAAETFGKELTTVQGAGTRPGKRVKRLNRNAVVKIDAKGGITLDAITRGMGFLFSAFFGSTTNTVVPASAPAVYQQVHTPSLTDPLKSYTAQKGIPPQQGGVVVPITLTGLMADTLDFELKGDGTLQIKMEWIGRDGHKDTSYAAPSYPADAPSNGLLTGVHATVGLGGALVAATATAIATGTTPTTKFRDLSISFKNNLANDAGWGIGGAGRRTAPNLVGELDISGKLTAEFENDELLTAFWAQTSLPLVVTLTHDVEIEPTLHLFCQLQIVLPSIRLKGETPKSNGGAPITQSIEFEAFDNGVAAQPVQVVYRTLDTTP